MNIWFFPGFIVVAWIALGLSFIECNNIDKTITEHEKDVLSMCQTVPRSDFVDCLKGEWNKINDTYEWTWPNKL